MLCGGRLVRWLFGWCKEHSLFLLVSVPLLDVPPSGKLNKCLKPQFLSDGEFIVGCEMSAAQ